MFMCISLKCWGALYVSTFSIVVIVEIKLLAQNLYTTLHFTIPRKAILQSWLFLLNFLNYSFSLALLLEFFAPDNYISLIIAFRTSIFQEKKN